MSDDQLTDALAERRQELFNLRFQSATGALENPARLKHGEAGDRKDSDRTKRARARERRSSEMKHRTCLAPQSNMDA